MTDQEPLDSELVRLIAYVKPISLSDDEVAELTSDEIKEMLMSEEPSNEYLIDFLTIKEAKQIGSEGIIKKVSEILIDKQVLTAQNQSMTWRLLRAEDLTPNEKTSKDYKVPDLRNLH
jgi:hypothetical protein